MTTLHERGPMFSQVAAHPGWKVTGDVHTAIEIRDRTGLQTVLASLDAKDFPELHSQQLALVKLL